MEKLINLRDGSALFVSSNIEEVINFLLGLNAKLKFFKHGEGLYQISDSANIRIYIRVQGISKKEPPKQKERRETWKHSSRART